MLKRNTQNLIKGIYKKTSAGLKFSLFGEVVTDTPNSRIYMKIHSLPSAFVTTAFNNYNRLFMMRSADTEVESTTTVSSDTIGGQSSPAVNLTVKRLSNIKLLPDYYQYYKTTHTSLDQRFVSLTSTDLNPSETDYCSVAICVLMKIDLDEMQTNDYVYIISSQSAKTGANYMRFSKSDISSSFVSLGDNVYALNVFQPLALSKGSLTAFTLPYMALLHTDNSGLHNITDYDFTYLDACMIFNGIQSV